MSDRYVVVARFADAGAAHLAKSYLESSGIPAFISDENSGSIFGTALGWVKVQVSEEDRLRAVAVLEASMGGHGEEEPEPSEDIMQPDDLLTSGKPSGPADPDDGPEEEIRRRGVFTPDAEQTGAITPIDMGLRERLGWQGFVASVSGLFFLSLCLFGFRLFGLLFLLTMAGAAYLLLRAWLADGPLTSRGRMLLAGSLAIQALCVIMGTLYFRLFWLYFS